MDYKDYLPNKYYRLIYTSTVFLFCEHVANDQIHQQNSSAKFKKEYENK